jgi:choice-of-anchor A domain-containing protein
MNRKIVLLAVSLGFASFSGVGRADSILGVASAYNLVALGNGSVAGNISDSSDVGGRVAAAGIVTLSSVGQSLVNDPNDALAGGYLVVAGGGVKSGDDIQLLSYGNAYALGATNSNFSFNDGGSLLHPSSSPIDFSTLSSTLDAESVYLGSLVQNGKLLTQGQTGFPSNANPSWLVLSGTSTTLNVFNLTASQLANQQLDIVVPTGSTVVINVSGTSDALGDQINLNGNQLSNTSDAAANILFNFDDATSLTLQAEMNGAVLAPFATVSGNSEIVGTLIAAQINDNGEVDNAEFTGILPGPPGKVTPEPSSLALLGTGLASVAGLAWRRRLLAGQVSA